MFFFTIFKIPLKMIGIILKICAHVRARVRTHI